MERESFEDERTAELLNHSFIAIKLDREERPDLDKIYMDAIHATGQQGGWPLNFFLTPDKEPIFGGTYFPPENRYGRKSFKEVLTLVQRSWENQREDLVNAAKELTLHLQKSGKSENGNLFPVEGVFQKSFEKYSQVYDPKYFGFIFNGTNKFPPSMALSYLLNYYYFFKAEFALEIVFNTIYAMKKGGIYDQVGGGISRYATDHEWLVPHFEKMLYDNSLFLHVIGSVYKVTKNPFFMESAMDIINYIRRDMALTEGGISSAEDADSEGEEGKFYIWSEAEFDRIVSDEELKSFWGVTKKGNFEGHNILNEAIQRTNPFQSELQPNNDLISKVTIARSKLLKERNARIRPLRDDKVILSWNCLYIQALIETFQASQKEGLLQEAIHIHRFLAENMRKPDGHLYRRYREGESKYEGNLCDYAEFILASLKLFQETEDTTYFENAITTLRIVESEFATDYGAYYDSISSNQDVLVRTVDGYDGVEPSGNSSMAHVYLMLAGLGYDGSASFEKAGRIFSYFSKELSQNTTSYPSMLDAYLKWKQKRLEVVVIYKEESKAEVKEIILFLRTNHLPNVTWLVVEESKSKSLENKITLLKNRDANGSHQVYVCQNFTCDLPVKGLEKMKELIFR
jgi:uncharacterized protein YyaL (SSP411 family)